MNVSDFWAFSAGPWLSVVIIVALGIGVVSTARTFVRRL
jgi:hypothetical protein